MSLILASDEQQRVILELYSQSSCLIVQSDESKQLLLSIQDKGATLPWETMQSYLDDPINKGKFLHSTIEKIIRKIVKKTIKGLIAAKKYSEAIARMAIVDNESGIYSSTNRYQLLARCHLGIREYQQAHRYFSLAGVATSTECIDLLVALVKRPEHLDYLKSLAIGEKSDYVGNVISNSVTRAFPVLDESASTVNAGLDRSKYSGIGQEIVIALPVIVAFFAVAIPSIAIFGVTRGIIQASTLQFLSVEEQKALIDNLHLLTKILPENKNAFIATISNQYGEMQSAASSDQSKYVYSVINDITVTLDKKIDVILGYMLLRNDKGYLENNGKNLFTLINKETKALHTQASLGDLSIFSTTGQAEPPVSAMGENNRSDRSLI